MAAFDRLTGLEMLVADLGGTDFIDFVTAYKWDTEGEEAESKGVADRYDDPMLVKAGDRFTLDLNVNQLTVLKTNLDVTVCTIGGVVRVADLRDGTIDFKNKLSDGGGVANLKKYPHAMGTMWMIDGEFFINVDTGVQTADLVQLMQSATVADKNVALSVTAGGIAIAGNGLLLNAGIGVETEEFITQTAKIKGKRAPTTCSGHSLVVSALAGTAAMAFSISSEAGTQAGNLVLGGGSIQLRDSAILGATFEAEVFGQPTFTP
jgi:hypothetical protein